MERLRGESEIADTLNERGSEGTTLYRESAKIYYALNWSLVIGCYMALYCLCSVQLYRYAKMQSITVAVILL